MARKRIAVDAVSQVAEGLEKKNKEVFVRRATVKSCNNVRNYAV